MENNQQLRVLLVGPSLEQKGGMASVQNLILDSASTSLHMSHVSTHDEGSVKYRLWVFAVALGKFLWQLVTNRVDLVHLHVSEKGSVLRKIVMLLVAKVFGKPVIVHTHGCEFHLFYDGLPRLAQRFITWALQQADCLVALSDSWKTYYVSRCHLDSDCVLVLPNPVEIPKRVPIRLSAPDAAINFAFLGRVGERKGTFDLIKAFANMPNRQRARLFIAGDGETAAAAALIEALGLQSSVVLLGWINQQQRSRLLEDAHVFALPSYNEGLPMALLEAMAAGLPVITTPVGGIPEFVNNGSVGYLVDPGDIEGLAQSMERLVDSEDLRQAMGKRARDRIRPLDLALYSRTLLTLYRSVADGAFLAKGFGVDSSLGDNRRPLDRAIATASGNSEIRRASGKSRHFLSSGRMSRSLQSMAARLPGNGMKR